MSKKIESTPPLYQKIFFNKNESELFKVTTGKFHIGFHFHPEIEITLVINGEGERFVGKSKKNFLSEDLVIIGSNLPHVWEIDAKWRKKNPNPTSKNLFIRNDKISTNFFNLMGADLKIFEIAEKGIVLKKGNIKNRITKILLGLDYNNTHIEKVINVLEIINELNKLFNLEKGELMPLDIPSITDEYEILNEEKYPHKDKIDFNKAIPDKLSRIIYSIHNTIEEDRDKENLKLGNLAKEIEMNPAALSRLFSKRMGMTIRDYIAYLKRSKKR